MAAIKKIFRLIVVVFILFTLWTGLTGSLEAILQRGIHLAFGLPLIFLIYPAKNKDKCLLEDARLSMQSIINIILILSSLVVIFWFILNRQRILFRIPYVSPILIADIIMGLLLVILVLEACRRSMGWPLVLIAFASFSYILLGPYMSGGLRHPGITLNTFVEYMILSTHGIFGSIVGLSATYLFMFIAFGQFLVTGGADKFYMNLMFGLAGRAPGGPAKVSIFSSAAMATISGSAVANVVGTGSMSIPMMKKTGFKPHEAAAVETAASTGGQVTPPIMGIGIFVMSELSGIPLVKLMGVSIIPAFLYYISIYSIITRIIKKRKIPIADLTGVPKVKETLIRGWIYLFPIIGLVLFLTYGYTPFRASAIAITLVIITNFIINNNKIDIKRLLKKFPEACEKSVKIMLPLIAVSATAEIVVTNITITGLPLKITPLLVSVSQNSIFICLILVALVCYIFGMGLPIVMSYVLTATLSVGALRHLGIPLLVAHMTIFWWSQLSTISPPVCMAAFAAARIANADPYKTGFTALLYGSGLLWVPFLFVYTPLLTGSWFAQLLACIQISLIVFALTSIIYGYFISHNHFTDTAFLFIASLLLIIGLFLAGGTMFTFLGSLLMAFIFFVQLKRLRITLDVEK